MHGLQSRLSQTLRLALLDRLSHELNADLSSSEVLRRVLNAAAEALGTPYASIIALKDRQLLAAYALGGGDRDPLPSIQRVLKDGLAGFVMYNYRTIIVNDITSNPLWLSLPSDPLSPQAGSALCVPLTHAGDMVGVMTLAHPATSYFTADAVSLTTMIGEMGAAALSSALLLEAAREAEKRYATLFDDVIVPIIVTDLQGQIRAVNRRACEFLGYSRDELLRLSILAVHRMGTGPLGKDRFENLAHGREEHFQSKVWTKDGGERVVHVYAKRVHSAAEGDSIQWIEHDISSQLTLERLRQDLSAMMYHDMRGPLGNVYSSLQALQQPPGRECRYQRAGAAADRGAQRAPGPAHDRFPAGHSAPRRREEAAQPRQHRAESVDSQRRRAGEAPGRRQQDPGAVCPDRRTPGALH